MEIDGAQYLPRIIDGQVERHLKAFGAVEIAGTMWSGKTWTSRAHGASLVSLDNPQSRELAQLDADAVLAGDAPHVIDEWQEAPAVWDAVRNRIDSSPGKRGLFILTGSSRPAKGSVRHSGSGRISRLHMLPMTLWESGFSHGSVSLSGLFDGEFESGPVRTNLVDLANLVCRGGWPGALGLAAEAALLVPSQYLDAIVAQEDPLAPGNERELRMFLLSMARNVGSAATLGTLAADMGMATDGEASDSATRKISALIDYFQARYVIRSLPGWDAPIKSPARLRTKPKRCFADPSLPAALLGASPQVLLGNLQLFGQLFEELCLRDLYVYASAMDSAQSDPLRYYRDSDGLEVDAVIERRDGRWGAIEVKLGANKVDVAVRNLLRLRKKVLANTAARNREPSFLMVLVGKTDYRYRTPEGVYVAPITELTV